MGEACGETCRSIKVGGLHRSGQGVFIIGFLWTATGFTVSLLSPVKWFGVEKALATGEGRRETLPYCLRSFKGQSTQKDEM